MIGWSSPGKRPGAADQPDCSAFLTLTAVIRPDLTLPVPARLRYHRGDPYAVHLDCHVETDEPIPWAFSRDLLAAGLSMWVGLGDVSVHPSSDPASDTFYICLHPPDQAAVLRAPRSLVKTFLRASYTIVPAGSESEHYDMDEMVGRFWGRDAPSAG
ncbi:SsgA family sporulation/cell division regulator [Streptomyces sp. NPDC051909]|uniref:SsgA family sporulation/cell division regulator n=1 Tax=Streptomyces sp. NPDC051909 TaxID=3154944 RepID=UPI0034412A32